jgi:hypothetical protein
MADTLITPEVEHLEARLKDGALDHTARADIGEQLDRMGDTRPGVVCADDTDTPGATWMFKKVREGYVQERKGSLYTPAEISISPGIPSRTNTQAFRLASDGFARGEWWKARPRDTASRRCLNSVRLSTTTRATVCPGIRGLHTLASCDV